MKNIFILTVALFITVANHLSAKVSTDALDYTYCTWNSWFEYPNKHSFYPGEDVYVRVKAQKYHDISYMEVFVNNTFIRKETSFPYEWCKPGSSGDHYLRNLNPGSYKIKCKIVDKCGGCHYITYDIMVSGGNNNHCNWNSWYHTPQPNKHYNKGCHVYVRIDCHQYQDIEFMELYVNNQFIRKETQYPYEWCKGSNGDHKLRNLQKGSYHLKAKIKDKCGQWHEKTSTFFVD